MIQEPCDPTQVKRQLLSSDMSRNLAVIGSLPGNALTQVLLATKAIFFFSLAAIFYLIVIRTDAFYTMLLKGPDPLVATAGDYQEHPRL